MATQRKKVMLRIGTSHVPNSASSSIHIKLLSTIRPKEIAKFSMVDVLVNLKIINITKGELEEAKYSKNMEIECTLPIKEKWIHHLLGFINTLLGNVSKKMVVQKDYWEFRFGIGQWLSSLKSMTLPFIIG